MMVGEIKNSRRCDVTLSMCSRLQRPYQTILREWFPIDKMSQQPTRRTAFSTKLPLSGRDDSSNYVIRMSTKDPEG